MKSRVKHILISLVPPILLQLALKSFGYKQEKMRAFSGDYQSWEEALKDSTGYDNPLILKKAKDALLKVKSGEAKFERDTVLFEVPDHSYPLLSALLYIALNNNQRLSVLDFGGSLGSTYFQTRNHLAGLISCQWSIIEQPHFVETGREYFADNVLKFYTSVDECLKHEKPNVVLLSGVIGYLEQPKALIKELIERDFDYIIFDRTLVMEDRPTRLVVQKVPPRIYDASYPCWIFLKEDLIGPFRNRYVLFDEFTAHLGTVVNLHDTNIRYKGFVFHKKTK